VERAWEPDVPPPALSQDMIQGILDDAVDQAQAPVPFFGAAPRGGPAAAVAPGAMGLATASPLASAPSPFLQAGSQLASRAPLGRLTPPEVFGDQAALSALQFVTPPVPPRPPVPGAPPGARVDRGAALLPSIRQFKIAEFESPRPLD